MEKCEVLVVRNGILDLAPLYSGGKPVLRPHSDDLFATNRTDYDYDPDAKCEKFSAFIEWFTCGRKDVETLIGEIFAYCLMLGLSFQKLFILVGPGANGKSVLLHVLRHLVGEDSCSAIPIERLGGRFTLSDMLDCRVNVAGDMNTVSKASEGTLKMLCDGSAVQSEAKFKPSFTIRPRTRFLFATNMMLRILDTSDGMWRRIIAILCDAKLGPGEKVNKLEEVLYAEVPGILNWVLSHAPALIERGDFTEPQCCRELLRQERVDANSVAAWFENCVLVDGQTFVGSTKMLIDHYTSWVRERNGIPVGMGRFRTELSRLLKPSVDDGKVKYTRGQAGPRGGLSPSDSRTTGKTSRGWKGICVAVSLDDGRDDDPDCEDEDKKAEGCEHDWVAENVDKEDVDALPKFGGRFTRRTCKKCGGVRFEQRRQGAVALDRRLGPDSLGGRSGGDFDEDKFRESIAEE